MKSREQGCYFGVSHAIFRPVTMAGVLVVIVAGISSAAVLPGTHGDGIHPEVGYARGIRRNVVAEGPGNEEGKVGSAIEGFSAVEGVGGVQVKVASAEDEDKVEIADGVQDITTDDEGAGSVILPRGLQTRVTSNTWRWDPMPEVDITVNFEHGEVYESEEDDDDDDCPDSEEDGTYAHETPGTGPDSGFVRHSMTRMDHAVPGKMLDDINEMMNLSRPKSPSRAPNSSRNIRIKSFDDEGDDDPRIATPVRMVKGIQSPSRNVRTSTWGGEGDAGPYRNPHGGRNMKSYGGDGDLGFATPKYQSQMPVMSGHGGPYNGFNRVPYSPNNGWAMSGFDRSPYGSNGGFNGGFNGGYNGYNGFNGGYGGFNGFNRNNFMNNALRAVQDFVESPSAFTPTIECPAKIGKYVCKIQCRMKDETLRGVCFHDSCFCAPQERKEALKHMSRSYRALVNGYDTICDNWKNVKQCMRFCKALTPNKSYTGICKDDHCQCVTNPSIPEAKKYACMKAIRKVKKMEDTALKYLGFRPLPLSQLSAAAEKKVNEVADATLRKLKSSNKIDGCTEEDIKNLRSILAGLAQGLSLARGDAPTPTPTPKPSNGSQESKPGAPSSAPRRFEPGSPGPRVKGT